MAERGRMRPYDPKLGGFEWRELPASEEEAFSLLVGYFGAEGHAAIHREWRDLGAGIAALIRAGEGGPSLAGAIPAGRLHGLRG